MGHAPLCLALIGSSVPGMSMCVEEDLMDSYVVTFTHMRYVWKPSMHVAANTCMPRATDSRKRRMKAH